MSAANLLIRPLHRDDFSAVLEIDEKVFRQARPEYYLMKFSRVLEEKDRMTASLVAEMEGKVVGFVMGELYMGEYGIFQEAATLDTIGVDPDYQHKGVGRKLINEFIDHLKKVGVKKVNALMDWNYSRMIQFFSENKFSPSKTINLERIL